MNATQTSEVKKTKMRMILFGGVGAVFFAGSVLLIVAYAVPGNWADVLRGKLFLPMVVVDKNQMISFREVASNLRAIRQFYESQNFSEVGLRVDFSGDDGKRRLEVRERELLNKMIEDRAIESLARSRGIVITDDMVDQSVKRKLDELGSTGAVEDDLSRLYGWTLNDFKNKIVRSSLYEEELNKFFLKEYASPDAAKVKIGEAETALARGSPFDQVAKDYSDGRTAMDGGKLGWFGLGDLIPELQKTVESARVGAVGSVVESPLGFHILLVSDARDENGVKKYELSQIFVKKPVFSDWLSDRMKQMNVWAFDTDYDWNQETARLEFRDETMRTFEENLREYNTGDAAFLFY